MKLRGLVLALAGAGVLVACGGGGSDSPGSSGGTPPRTTGKISLSGVVAVGQAVANTDVKVSCLGASNVNVTTTGRTDASGRYSVEVPNASLPCVLSVDTTNSSGAAVSLASLAQGSGPDTAVANITPVTTLVVASVANTDPATFIAGFGPTSAAKITESSVSSAVTEVTAQLDAIGVTLPAVNVLKGELIAATGTTTGNDYDQALDRLGQTLTDTGTTLDDLVATVSAAPTLPAALLSLPKSSTCDALRSTNYRVINLEPSDTTGSTDPVTTTATINLDAVTLVASLGTRSQPAWTPVADDKCRYTDSEGADIVVSPAGVVVARDAGTSSRLWIAFPAQSHALTDLAGTWNALGWDYGTPNYTINAGTATIDSTGQVTSARCFEDAIATPEAACTVETTLLPKFSVNPAGGFFLDGVDRTNIDSAWRSRVFGYRAGNGELMMVMIDPDGSFTFWTRQRTNVLPTINDVTAYWNTAVDVNGLGVPNDLAFTRNTNTVKTASGIDFTRDNRVNIGATSEHTRTESLRINQPRNGYNQRLAQQVVDTGGVTRNVSAFYSMNLRGMGLVPVYIPPSTSPVVAEQFQLSVVRQP